MAALSSRSMPSWGRLAIALATGLLTTSSACARTSSPTGGPEQALATQPGSPEPSDQAAPLRVPVAGTLSDQPSIAQAVPTNDAANDPLRNAPSPELPRHDAPVNTPNISRDSKCPMLEPVPTSAVPAWRLKTEGSCRPAAGESPVLLSVAVTTPRRIGFSDATVLHAGDAVLTTPGLESWLETPDAQSRLPKELPRDLDPKFAHFKGKLPSGTQPLKTLAKQTGGALEALGTFAYYDGRPADGAETLKLLLHAGKPGTFTLTLKQQYERESRRGPENGVLEQHLSLRVVPAGTAIEAQAGELEPGDRTITLGVGDYLALPVTLGSSNRGGSETRSAPGVSVTR